MRFAGAVAVGVIVAVCVMAGSVAGKEDDGTLQDTNRRLAWLGQLLVETRTSVSEARLRTEGMDLDLRLLQERAEMAVAYCELSILDRLVANAERGEGGDAEVARRLQERQEEFQEQIRAHQQRSRALATQREELTASLEERNKQIAEEAKRLMAIASGSAPLPHREK